MSGHTCAHAGICTHSRCAGKCPFHYLTPALPRELTEEEQDLLMFDLSREEQAQLLIELSQPHPLLKALGICIGVMEQVKK